MKRAIKLMSLLLVISCTKNYKNCVKVKNNSSKFISKMTILITESNNIELSRIEFKIRSKKANEKYYYLLYDKDIYFINYGMNDSCAITDDKNFYIYRPKKIFESRSKEKKYKGINVPYYYIENKDLEGIVCDILNRGKIVSQDAYGNKVYEYNFSETTEVNIIKENVEKIVSGYVIFYPSDKPYAEKYDKKN